jgi:subtilisin family serine protease
MSALTPAPTSRLDTIEDQTVEGLGRSASNGRTGSGNIFFWARPVAVLTTLVTSSLAVLSLAAPTAASAEPQRLSGTADRTERYIVVLRDSAGSARTAAIEDGNEFGVEVKGVYSHSITGYVAEMTDEERARLAADPDVAYMEPDGTMEIAGQVVPTGVARVDATTNANLDIDGIDDRRIDVDVAVIDTGVAPQPDLNVVESVDCTTGTCLPGGTDDNGHGSHVAGTIGAIDNQIGVVGVAPGARIHSIKVCDAKGRCANSAVLAAVDYVTAHADVIEVANMSLGSPGPNRPLDDAIALSVDAGVIHVVAAGNSNRDARDYSPASSPDAITVSALSDSDGTPGGTGGIQACRPDSDDTAAVFSNYGPAIDITAPGVCILSTWHDGTLKNMSGTSMAAPHVAGAAALLASGTHDPTNRTDVETLRPQLLETGNTDWYESSPDQIQEPLLDLHTTLIGQG